MSNAQNTTEILTTLTNIDGKTLSDVINPLYQHINTFISLHGADAWNGILFLLQFKSIWDLVIGFILLGVSYIFIYHLPIYVYRNKKIDYDATLAGILLSEIIGFVALLGSLKIIFAFQLWLTAFAPELGLAYKVISGVIPF